MNIDVEKRLTEPVTVVSRVGEDWTSATYPRCNWVEDIPSDISSEGQISKDPVLVVQIPEDQGLARANVGDWLVRGSFSYTGDTRGLMQALPEGSRRITSVSDRRGGLSGISGNLTRYASVLIVEAR